MKRLLGIKKKKKVKNEDDDGPSSSYEPPFVDVADQVLPNNINSHGNNNPTTDDNNSSHSPLSGYQYTRSLYADTIPPALSNEDGMGGGGGTLRSRSGRVRGSAGAKHRGSLIPAFHDDQYSNNNNNNNNSALNAAISPTNSTTSWRHDHQYESAYERLMGRSDNSRDRNYSNNSNNLSATANNANLEGAALGVGERKSWEPIPEEPHSPTNTDREPKLDEIIEQIPPSSATSSKGGHNVTFRTETLLNEVQNQNQHQQLQEEEEYDDGIGGVGSLLGLCVDSDRTSSTQDLSTNQQQQQQNMQRQQQQHLASSIRSRQGNETNTIDMRSSSTQSSSSHISTFNPNLNINTTAPNKNLQQFILQPDAIYEEHYGDAYVDSLIKYLYPSGYQSMRPRSGPWKLSIFIFLLFLWLSVFIVGHCYDRGQQYYDSGYFDYQDDAYLQEVDDDMLVMETRWCGSKLLYFMWIVSVWITVLSMSYCSIIGYVKVRDNAVANGRSQPPGMGITSSGRSDYYVMVENVGNVDDGGRTTPAEAAACASLGNNITSVGSDVGTTVSAVSSTGEVRYPSYQDGSSRRRYGPSIYQSDGTPQFWGGHIYRPTQAAVAMTNRP